MNNKIYSLITGIVVVILFWIGWVSLNPADKKAMAQFISVKDLVDELAGTTGFNWEVAKEYFNGKKYVYSLFAKGEGSSMRLDVGDTVGLGIIAWNSYDGSVSFNLRFMAYRLACLNGMLSANSFSSFKFKHGPESDNYEEEVKKATKMLEGGPKQLRAFATACNNLNRTITLDDLADIRTNVIPDIPTSIYGKIVDEYFSGMKNREESLDSKTGIWTGSYMNTAWDFLNASTRVLWHNDKTTVADYKHNQYIVDNMMNAYEG